MKIIYAEKKLIPQIARIASESFSDPWSEKSLHSAFDSGAYIFLAALEGEETAGYLIGTVSPFGASVESIAVSRKFRRKGIGTLLLSEICRIARQTEGYKGISLEVRASNAAAIQMYEKLGFQKKAVRKALYDFPREDGIVMIKEFEEN